MQDFLKAEGMAFNHKRVRRLLRKMGLMAIYPNNSKIKRLKKNIFVI